MRKDVCVYRSKKRTHNFGIWGSFDVFRGFVLLFSFTLGRNQRRGWHAIQWAPEQDKRLGWMWAEVSNGLRSIIPCFVLQFFYVVVVAAALIDAFFFCVCVLFSSLLATYCTGIQQGTVIIAPSICTYLVHPADIHTGTGISVFIADVLWCVIGPGVRLLVS